MSSSNNLLVAQNAAAIKVALRDYVAHVYPYSIDKGIFADDISDAFINRLAEDATQAKSGLRDMFRKVDGWREDLQAVVINGTTTHDPDDHTVHQLIDKIFSVFKFDMGTWSRLYTACRFFKANGETDTEATEKLQGFIGNKFRPDRKKSRLFQELAKAVGVYDGKAGSNYQRLFAKLADELNGCKLDFKLFLSINPAHILTASNPLSDKRGQSLVSCHSLNRDDYFYGTGNIGYARDYLTFVAFTVKNPDEAETLNNRKTTRQFFHYKPNSGVLLQSRLYDTYGGTCGDKDIASLYRDLVQRTIATAENANNLWSTRNYYDNKFDIYFGKDKNFGGYDDWTRYANSTIKIAVRKDCLDSAYGTSYIIGAPSLCTKCGDEVIINGNKDNADWRCEKCYSGFRTCAECGKLVPVNYGELAFDSFEDEVFVCSDCLEEHYYLCEDCDRYHRWGNCTAVDGGRVVCNNCLEKNYEQCEICGEWTLKSDVCKLKDADGDYITVCQYCYDKRGVDCKMCGERCHESAIDGDGYCCECWEGKADEGHTA